MARTIAKVTPERLAELEAGAPSTHLTEILAITQSRLATSITDNQILLAAIAQVDSLGIAARMRSIGRILHEHLSADELETLARHPSDTIRGWTCFAIVHDERAAKIDWLLAALRPFANDDHFGVREWSWLAARPRLVASLDGAIAALCAWTSDESANIRRFASESLRPRGVWAQHIAELKSDPQRGLPLIEPLRADPSTYVQDSVANWLNDASKTQPEWVEETCARWLDESPCDNTQRIVSRALRSLKRS